MRIDHPSPQRKQGMFERPDIGAFASPAKSIGQWFYERSQGAFRFPWWAANGVLYMIEVSQCRRSETPTSLDCLAERRDGSPSRSVCNQEIV